MLVRLICTLEIINYRSGASDLDGRGRIIAPETVAIFPMVASPPDCTQLSGHFLHIISGNV